MERITRNSLTAQVSYEKPAQNSEKRGGWLFNAGLISLLSGMLAPVFGSLLTAASWLVENDGSSHLLHKFGSVFLISTIPLLILAAFCLDSYEKRGNRIDFDWFGKGKSDDDEIQPNYAQIRRGRRGQRRRGGRELQLHRRAGSQSTGRDATEPEVAVLQ